MLEIEASQLHTVIEQQNTNNFVLQKKSDWVENNRKYKAAVIAVFGSVILLSTATHIPLAAIAGMPMEQALFYTGGVDPALENPNFVIYYIEQGFTNPVGALIHALESVGIGDILDALGLSWLTLDIADAAARLVVYAVGTQTEIYSVSDVIIYYATTEMPWWADWAVPLLVGQAVAIATF